LEENPELLTSLSVRNKTGRPIIEEEKPSLLGTIVDIAIVKIIAGLSTLTITRTNY